MRNALLQDEPQEKVIYLIPTFHSLAELIGVDYEQYINNSGEVFRFWNGKLDTVEGQAAKPATDPNQANEDTLILEAA